MPRRGLHDRKRSRPFGLPRTPYDPYTGKHLAFGDDIPGPNRAKFVAGSETDNTIKVKLYDQDGALIPEEITVSKAIGLRRQDYDGLTYDGGTHAADDPYTYSYLSANSRIATDAASNQTTQYIVPSYNENLELLVVRPIGGTGVDDVGWQDVTPGRAFEEVATGPGIYRAEFVPGSDGENTIQVYLYNSAGELGTELITVAKAIQFRKSEYHEKTIYSGGRPEFAKQYYEYVNTWTRLRYDIDNDPTLTNPYDQFVLPRYDSTDHALLVFKPVGGTGEAGVEWLDITPGRIWYEYYYT